MADERTSEDNKSMAQSQPPDDEKPFLFRKLPPEIRNAIYDLIFVTARFATSFDDRVDITSNSAIPHALARTCRAVREEALSHFFKNKFKANIVECNASPIEKWFNHFDEDNVTRIDLQVNWFPSLNYRSVLSSRMPLRRIHFLHLLERAFKGQVRSWPTLASREWIWQLPPAFASLPSSELMSGPIMGVPPSKRVEQLLEIVELIEEMRKQGVDWKDAKPAIEKAVDSTSICG